jgi:hypothetical protein
MIIGELKELDAKYEQYLQNTISNDDIPKMFKQMNIPSSPIEVSPACKNNLNQYFNTAKIALKNRLLCR